MGPTMRRRRSHRALSRSHRRESACERVRQRSRSTPVMTNTRRIGRPTASAGPARSCRSGPIPTTRPTSPAGVMAAAADRGERVVCVSATAGEHGTADPDAWPPAPARPGAPLGGGRGDGRARRHRAPHPRPARRRARRPTTPRASAARRPAARRGPAGHDPHVRPRRDDVPPRPHRRRTAGSPRAWAATRASAADCSTPTTTVEHLARFGELYEEWGMYMTDERPTGVPGDRARPPRPSSTAATSTASSRHCARWRPRPPA